MNPEESANIELRRGKLSILNAYQFIKNSTNYSDEKALKIAIRTVVKPETIKGKFSDKRKVYQKIYEGMIKCS